MPADRYRLGNDCNWIFSQDIYMEFCFLFVDLYICRCNLDLQIEILV